MSEEKKIVLIGGDKNGEIIEWGQGISQINHVKVNETLDGPAYVDHYVPSNLLDRDGRIIYVAEGRYNAEESQTFWESLDTAYRMQLVEAAKEEAAEEAAKEENNEESPNDDASDAGDESNSGSDDTPSEEAPAEEVSSEPASDDEAAGEEAGATEDESSDKVTEVEEEKKD